MSILGNGAYNSPAMAQAAENIANMLTTSPSEHVAYSTAALNRQKHEQLAQLFGAGANPSEQSALVGIQPFGQTPLGFREKYQADNATQRYGFDTQAATQRANNLLDNQTKIATSFAGPADPTHSSLGLTPELADHFAMPEIAARAGTPAPLSMTQWQAQQAQRLIDEGQLDDEALKSVIMKGADGSAAQERINLLANQLLSTDFDDPLLARNIAVGIVAGRYTQSRDPITGVATILDMATGRPVQMAAAPAADDAGAVDPVVEAATRPDFGEQYPAARESFGVGGTLAGGINKTLDAIGVGAPYKDIQQTQADFGVLRESLLNDIASAYGRQPPSWLLQRIDALTPAAGNPLEGPEGAISKLTAIGRSFAGELKIAEEALQRPLSPANRQEAESKVAGLQAGIARVETALGRLTGPASAAPLPNAADVPEGVDPADWQYMSEDERELFR